MNVLNINDRLRICLECPIYSPSNGRCNSKLWINPDTNDVSTTAKNGYIRGCNCVVKIKMKNKNAHCIAGKW